MKQFLECGRIVNTHGLRGEVKAEPWSDSPEFFRSLTRVFIASREFSIEPPRIQNRMVILKLSGVDDINAAIALKGKVLLFDRADVPLEPGTFYVQDAIGLPVYVQDGSEIGVLSDVMTRPASEIYVVRGSSREYLIPNVPEFVKSVDLQRGIVVSLIDGM
ncbi:MAG: ribosome maturation factor RimM [Oscillospiraceae bacterium]|nr:ribosome maturation factor RimM [Oscillospiraceae bacterium]